MPPRYVQAVALASLLTATLTPGCASTAVQPERTVFEHPSAYSGREVRVCGFMADPFNIWEARPRHGADSPRGLSVKDESDEPFDPAWRCLSGRVVRMGWTQETICFGWRFNYGIEVSGRP